MTDMRLLVWADDAHAALLARIVDGLGARVSAIGSPDASAARAIAAPFDAVVETDPRRLVARDGGDALLVLTLDGFDRDMLPSAPERPVVCLEPPVGGELPASAFAPRFRAGSGFAEALDVLDDFGAARALHVRMTAPPGTGSLHARLVDALDVIGALLPPVETAAAALVPAVRGVPERARDLRGTLTAAVRCADGRGASLLLADDAGGWSRSVMLVGAGGTLEIDDAGLRWRRADDADERRAGTDGDDPDPAALLAATLRRRLEHRDPAAPPPDLERLHVLAETVRLACRTGQCESAARAGEIAGRI